MYLHMFVGQSLNSYRGKTLSWLVFVIQTLNLEVRRRKLWFSEKVIQQESGASSLLRYASGFRDHRWEGAEAQYQNFREQLGKLQVDCGGLMNIDVGSCECFTLTRNRCYKPFLMGGLWHCLNHIDGIPSGTILVQRITKINAMNY